MKRQEATVYELISGDEYMRLITKGIVSVLFVLAVAVVVQPVQAALTTDQVNAVVGLLQSFGADAGTIANVQATLQGAGATSSAPQSGLSQGSQERDGQQGGGQEQGGQGTMPPGQTGKAMCIALNRNLGIGSSGDDVRQLQNMLSEDPEDGFTASSTGFFGPLTARAMARFQENNGIASSSTGIVGPLTRGFFERHCGEGLGNGHGQGEDRGSWQNMTGTSSAPMMPWRGNTDGNSPQNHPEGGDHNAPQGDN